MKRNIILLFPVNTWGKKSYYLAAKYTFVGQNDIYVEKLGYSLTTKGTEERNLRVNFFIIMAVICVLNVNAEIYRWTDENGVIHYGQQPPSLNESEIVDPLTNSRINALQVDKKERKEPVKDQTQTSKEITLLAQANSSKINCNKSVEYAQETLNRLIEKEKKSFNNGFIDQSELEKTTFRFSALKSTFTLTTCEGASGEVKDFFICISNYKNHFRHCLDEYEDD